MPSPRMKRLNKLHKIKKAAERKPGVFSKVAKQVGLSVEESAEETVAIPEPVVEEVAPVPKKVKKAKKTLKTDD